MHYSIVEYITSYYTKAVLRWSPKNWSILKKKKRVCFCSDKDATNLERIFDEKVQKEKKKKEEEEKKKEKKNLS